MSEDNLTNNLTQTDFSVSEISSKIKWLLENDLGVVKIKGEISGLKIAASGHGYFSLKDNRTILAAICWRRNLTRVSFKLEEGLEVIVTGKITAYAGQSKYQISVDHIEPSGSGAFMKILRERRVKLEQEKLFAKGHKKKLPYLPKKIGIITSISGAVIKDIIHRIADRCHTHLVIWPVAVQGESSADEISNAIDEFNKLDIEQRPDLLIVARGGGSIEDLWSFNEENVVRSAYNSKIPIISAVGHETDYTLIDLAADVRAPTPTAAVEFAIPVASDLRYTINALGDRMHTRLTDLLKYYSQKLSNNKRALEQVKNSIENYSQKIDDLSLRLLGSLPKLLKQKNNMLEYFPISRIEPVKILKYKYLQYKQFDGHLLNKSSTLLNEYKHKLTLNSSLLNSLDYNNVLKRGFAMVSNSDGKYISKFADSKQSPVLSIKMQDGTIEVVKK